jgi:hypothetical protein
MRLGIFGKPKNTGLHKSDNLPHRPVKISDNLPHLLVCLKKYHTFATLRHFRKIFSDGTGNVENHGSDNFPKNFFQIKFQSG